MNCLIFIDNRILFKFKFFILFKDGWGSWQKEILASENSSTRVSSTTRTPIGQLNFYVHIANAQIFKYSFSSFLIT